MLISFFLVIIIFTSLTVLGQPSPWFHVESWLPYRNREMDYSFLPFAFSRLRSAQSPYIVVFLDGEIYFALVHELLNFSNRVTFVY